MGALVWPQGAKAGFITFTDVVNTPDEWSFNFSGNGLQVIANQAPAPVGWSVLTEGAAESLTGYFMWYIQLSHSPEGPLLTGDVRWAPYGSTRRSFMTLLDDGAWDSVEMSLMVIGERAMLGGQTGLVWGDFSGRFKAVHRPVPDGGAPLALLTFGVGMMACVRRAVLKAEYAPRDFPISNLPGEPLKTIWSSPY